MDGPLKRLRVWTGWLIWKYSWSTLGVILAAVILAGIGALFAFGSLSVRFFWYGPVLMGIAAVILFLFAQGLKNCSVRKNWRMARDEAVKIRDSENFSADLRRKLENLIFDTVQWHDAEKLGAWIESWRDNR